MFSLATDPSPSFVSASESNPALFLRLRTLGRHTFLRTIANLSAARRERFCCTAKRWKCYRWLSFVGRRRMRWEKTEQSVCAQKVF